LTTTNKDIPMTITFPPLSVDTAGSAARGMLAASQSKFGFLPSPVARVAHAPGVLQHLFASFAAFDRTSLTPFEREVIAMTVAFEHGCHYCMAMHTAMQAGIDDVQPIVTALRAGEPLPDARLDALRTYARSVLRERGHVPPAIGERFAEAGYSAQQALEVVLGVSVYALSTFLNIVTDAQLDPPFEAFRWSAS
jgi:AhpD family alkylhydroperoxidase